jgi:hypothetical protein
MLAEDLWCGIGAHHHAQVERATEGPRQFSQLFTNETGQAPAKAIELLRLESARLMMEVGRFSAERSLARAIWRMILKGGS